MPWIPELFSDAVLDGWRARRGVQDIADVPYFDGLVAGEPAALVGSFSGTPEIHHPAFGRFRGAWELEAYAVEVAGWFRMRDTVAERRRRVAGPASVFEEIALTTPQGVLPLAIVADHADGRRLEEIRIYFSVKASGGRPITRPPLLQVDTDLVLPPVLAEYLRALADADYTEATAAYAAGATVTTSDGTVLRDIHPFHQRLCAAGGMRLDPCAVTGDGRHVAVEFNLFRYGDRAIPRQAGLAVFDLEHGGHRIRATRLYEDADVGELRPPGA